MLIALMRRTADERAYGLARAFLGIDHLLVAVGGFGSRPSVVAAGGSCSQGAFHQLEAFRVVELGQHVGRGLRGSRGHQLHQHHSRCRLVREHSNRPRVWY
jgi:hypothetical protein